MGRGQMMINYQGPASNFHPLLHRGRSPEKVCPRHFSGKIVMVGATATGIGDLHARVIRAAIGSAAKIADACGSRADHDNFFLKSAWGKLFLENVHDGVVGEKCLPDPDS